MDRVTVKHPIVHAASPGCKYDPVLKQIVCGIGLTDKNANARTAELSECIRVHS